MDALICSDKSLAGKQNINKDAVNHMFRQNQQFCETNITKKANGYLPTSPPSFFLALFIPSIYADFDLVYLNG